jgi:hypothetical protein
MYKMCRWVFGFLNFFARPKPITLTWLPRLDVSMDKVVRVNVFVHDHNIVITLSPEPLDKRHPDAERVRGTSSGGQVGVYRGKCVESLWETLSIYGNH